MSSKLFIVAGILASFVSLSVFSAPAQASSLPKADQRGHSFSLGTAPSLAAEFSLSPQWAMGASMAMPFYYGSFGFIRYDLRTSYTLLQNSGLTLRGIAGIFGDVDTQQRQDLILAPIGIEAGIGLSYQINEWFTGRVNIVAGIGFPRSSGWGLFPPAGGIEIGFRPYDNFEATVGFNGNGDILSIRYLY